jgi:WD40 repeat protein
MRSVILSVFVVAVIASGCGIGDSDGSDGSESTEAGWVDSGQDGSAPVLDAGIVEAGGADAPLVVDSSTALPLDGPAVDGLGPVDGVQDAPTGALEAGDGSLPFGSEVGAISEVGTPPCPVLVRPAPTHAGSILPAQRCGFSDGTAVHSAGYSAQTDTLVLGTSEGNVKFFRASDGMPGPVLAAHPSRAQVMVAISPDGTTLATSSHSALTANTEVKLWRLPSLELIKSISTDAYLNLTFSQNGTLLAASTYLQSTANYVQLWKASDGTPARAPIATTGMVDAFALSPDGSMLAAGVGLSVTVWRLSDDKTLSTFIVPGTATTATLAFSPNSQRLAAVASYDLSLWSVSDWTMVFPAKATLGVGPIAFSPDGSRIAGGFQLSGAGIGAVALIDSNSGAALGMINSGRGEHLQFASDGNSLIDYGSVTTFVAAPSGVVLSSWRDPQVLPGNLVDMAFIADDSSFVVLTDTAAASLCTGSPQLGSSAPIGGEALAPDGSLIAHRSTLNNSIELFSVPEFARLKNLSTASLGAALGFSPSADHLLFSGMDLWSVALDQLVLHFADPFGYASPAFSPDGTQLAVANGNHGGNSYPIKLLDMGTGAVTNTLSGNLKVTNLAYTHDGLHLVAGGISGAVVWDLVTKTATSLANATPPFATSSKGGIATAGPNSTVLLWTDDGQTLQGSLPLDWTVGRLAFSKDGTVLATNSYGMLQFWCP